MHRRALAGSLAAIGLSLTLAAAPGAGARTSNRPIARAAGTCSIGSGRQYGYSYLTWLWVYRTSCQNGSKLAKKHGHMRRWHCHRNILDRSPVQYDAKVTCTRGRREVAWTYTQNT